MPIILYLRLALSETRGKDPLRIIVDTNLRTPLNAKILNHDSSSDTLIVVGSHVRHRELKRFQKKGVSTLVCPMKAGMIDLAALMGILGKMSVTSLLVEGGSLITGSMLREKLVDKFYIFKAPKILGGGDGVPMAAGPGSKKMDECLVLKDIHVRRFEDDILMVGYPEYYAPYLILPDPKIRFRAQVREYSNGLRHTAQGLRMKTGVNSSHSLLLTLEPWPESNIGYSLGYK